MKSPDKPDDEFHRLSTLRGLNILDTPSEERFDRLVRTAKRLFDVPIALVSLVDENRQWFKSSIGLEAKETPREVSFCGHAILGDDVFIIEDAVEDPRFADNPLVTGEPFIRFYAGCPLRAANGCKLGTLCVIDTECRRFSEEDQKALQDLASMVESELAAMVLATQDELTQILNRRGFMLLAEQVLTGCTRHGLSGALVFIDLDNFKGINDQWGHREGDRVLQVFADGLQAEVRESDLCARLGGDEFVLLLTDTRAIQAQVLMDRLRRHLAENKSTGKTDYLIEFSHGVVPFDGNHPVELGDLLELGDVLMYRDKSSA